MYFKVNDVRELVETHCKWMLNNSPWGYGNLAERWNAIEEAYPTYTDKFFAWLDGEWQLSTVSDVYKDYNDNGYQQTCEKCGKTFGHDKLGIPVCKECLDKYMEQADDEWIYNRRCVDCGTWYQKTHKATKTIRCPFCQYTKNRNDTRLRVKKFREKQCNDSKAISET